MCVFDFDVNQLKSHALILYLYDNYFQLFQFQPPQQSIRALFFVHSHSHSHSYPFNFIGKKNTFFNTGYLRSYIKLIKHQPNNQLMINSN